MIIKNEDIICYETDEEHYCPECFDYETNEYKPMTEDDLDDNLTLICDKCKKIIEVS